MCRPFTQYSDSSDSAVGIGEGCQERPTCMHEHVLYIHMYHIIVCVLLACTCIYVYAHVCVHGYSTIDIDIYLHVCTGTIQYQS